MDDVVGTGPDENLTDNVTERNRTGKQLMRYLKVTHNTCLCLELHKSFQKR